MNIPVYHPHSRLPERMVLFMLLAVLASCGSLPGATGFLEKRDGAPPRPIDVSSIPDATPRAEKYSRYGNPTSYVIDGKRFYVLQSSKGYVERGIASWYGTKFHGRRTSSGEPYNMYAMTAAHKTLPLPSYARITNLRNGRQVVVRINDRGPFKDNRILDLSYAAAAKLGITETGTGLIELKAIDPLHYRQEAQGTPTKIGTQHNVDLYLQVGAFVDYRNAQQLRARLRKIAAAGIQVSHAKGNRYALYRVRIGPLPSVEEADRIAGRLVRLGLGDPHIVID